MFDAASNARVDDGEGRFATTGRLTTEAWLDLIQRRCGLVFRPAQVSEVMRTLVEARRARSIETPHAYYQLLEKEPEDGTVWSSLIERLVNHETSFFRHNASFDAMRTVVLSQLLHRPGGLLAGDGGAG